MKTIAGYIASYTLFWLGCLFVRINTQWAFNWYNSLMISSVRIQDWAGNKRPWDYVTKQYIVVYYKNGEIVQSITLVLGDGLDLKDAIKESATEEYDRVAITEIV